MKKRYKVDSFTVIRKQKNRIYNEGSELWEMSLSY